jgi:drug/metabolite transporter (DMT)-like permease
MNNWLLGIVLVALGSAFFSIAGLFVQFTEGKASSWVALFVGLSIGAVIVVPVALTRLGWRRVVAPEHRWKLIVRGLVSCAQVGALFFALHSIPLTDAMLFRNTAPLWLPIFSALLLGERMPLKFWPVIAAGFFGVGLVLHPHVSGLSIGYLIAILNGILFAFQNLLTRHLNKLNEPQDRILLYLYVVAAASSFAPAWMTVTPLDLPTVGWLVLSGIFMLCSTGCMIFAFGYAPAWQLAPIGYSAVVIAALLDWLVFNHTPDPIAAAGMVIVVLSGILIIVLGTPKRQSSPTSQAQE